MSSPTPTEKEIRMIQHNKSRESKALVDSREKTDRGHGHSPEYFCQKQMSRADNKLDKREQSKLEALPQFVDYPVGVSVKPLKINRHKKMNICKLRHT